MDLPTTDQILSLLQLLTPGIIITAIRSRSATGLAPDLKDRILEFAVISVIYSAIATPIFTFEGGISLGSSVWNLLYSVCFPIVIGILLAYSRGYQLTYRLAELIRLPIAHHLPTAWDYTFDGIKAGTFILITMKDGTKVPGRYKSNSFASSSETERDILVDEVWEIEEDGSWREADPARNILICDKDIKFVEIFNEQ